MSVELLTEVEILYSTLIEDFFTYEKRETPPRITISPSRKIQVYPNIQEIEIPTMNNIANLIYTPEIAELEYDYSIQAFL